MNALFWSDSYFLLASGSTALRGKRQSTFTAYEGFDLIV
jgi:hypothetical protein